MDNAWLATRPAEVICSVANVPRVRFREQPTVGGFRRGVHDESRSPVFPLRASRIVTVPCLGSMR